jgi:DNA-binding NarL/FixJ family response regulator
MKKKKRKLKVFIMDDSDIFRAGLIQMFEQRKGDFELTGREECSNEAEILCTVVAPDVLILHTSAWETDKQLQIAGRIKEKMKNTRVLFISEFDDTEYLLGILASSCDGHVHSGISRRSFIKAIKNFGHDSYTSDQEGIKRILSLKDNERASANKLDFRPRERQIVEMLRDGKNTATIAKELELSIGTVKNAVTRMLRRYQLKNKAQLVDALLSD